MSSSRTAKYFKKTFKIDLTIDEMLAKMDEYAQPFYERWIPLKPYVREKLMQLKKDGHSLNILTASPHKMLDPCLKRLGIWGLFDNVWSCDDFKTTKSDVNIYNLVAEKLNIDISELIFFDDNIEAIRTAKKVNCLVYGVYDDSSLEQIETIKKSADKFIYSFEEIEL